MSRYRDTLWGALDTTLHNVGLLLLLNLATTLILFPVLALLTVALGSTGLLSAFPLAAGLIAGALTCPVVLPLQIAGNRQARGYALWLLRDSREELAKHGTLLVQLWLVDIFVTAVLIGNLAFYTVHTSPIAIGLRVVFIYVLFGWLAAHLYIFPLVLEDRVSGLLETYRTALQLTLLFPVFTMVIGAIWIVLLVFLSLTGVLAVLGLAFTVAIQQHALAALLNRDPLES